MRLDQKIAEMAARLTDVGIETARLDARLLAAHGLDLSDTALVLEFDRDLSLQEVALLDGLLGRRLTREPIAHITGEREFWGLPFKVTSDTLVPRPDSETLVAGILDRISDRSAALKLVDIGTGTGCLLLSLLTELPKATGLGVDINPAALDVAQDNAKSLGLDERARFCLGNYADGVDRDVDILVSNPPYLAQREVETLEKDVADYDPRAALVSGESGLEAYLSIFGAVSKWQHAPWLMAFEFGHQQAADVLAIARETGLIAKDEGRATILRDLGNRDRILLIDHADLQGKG